MANAIFFEDLNKDRQRQLVKDEIESTLQESLFSHVTIYIEKDPYGYDPDPKKQTLEQHIHARVIRTDDKERKVRQWLMVWNCFDHEFNTIMEESTEDMSFKEHLTLRGIIVCYPPITELKEGMDASIMLSVETEQNRFGVKLEVAVPENISEKDKYELARKFMGQAAFQMMSIDRRYKNGCNIDDAVKEIGKRMPDIVQAISERKEYKYIVKPE